MAAPDTHSFSELVSYFSRSGRSRMKKVMTGTRIMAAIFSSWMVFIMYSGLKTSVGSTIVAPVNSVN